MQFAPETGALEAGSVRYRRHRPEETLLYQIVERHYSAFVEHLAEAGKHLPGHVRQAFDAYLQCGRLKHGFLRLHARRLHSRASCPSGKPPFRSRLRCTTCHAEHLLAFSCKRRGFCPSCGARRMADGAASLVDQVLPERPIRQWVLSLPLSLRFLLATNPTLISRVLGIVYRVIAAHLIKQAGYTQQSARTGAITFIQRFGSALNLNIHFHMLFLDRVYVVKSNGTRLRFQWVREPTFPQLSQLAYTIAHRVARLLERDTEQLDLRDVLDEDDPMPDLVGHSITYRNAVGPHRGRKVYTLQTMPTCDEGDWAAGDPGNVAGFSLHAGVAAKACQRDKLERLCRYICRPPLSEKRLFLTARGDIGYTLKTPYRDGTTHVIFEPLDFIARLAARTGGPCPSAPCLRQTAHGQNPVLVPPPRLNLTRFHPALFTTVPSRGADRPCGRGVSRPSAPEAYSPVR